MTQEVAEFDWDDANRRHLAFHNVTPEEAEQAMLDSDAILLEVQTAYGEERVKALGIIRTGRILVVVFTLRGGAIRPITAYTAPARLQALYLRQRGL